MEKNDTRNVSEHVLAKLDEYKRNLQNFQSQIVYSTRYLDDQYEYRHAFLPRGLSEMIPSNHLLTETEWRNLGVQQSLGWEHFMIHKPEPHILLFRRPVNNDIAMN